ncbi:hypothetical protein IKE98_01950 [Candidatus Saccharibacteria bacterium]|nr:hypothetical protein [Candidatus Saccharibacteria bacterium]
MDKKERAAERKFRKMVRKMNEDELACLWRECMVKGYKDRTNLELYKRSEIIRAQIAKRKNQEPFIAKVNALGAMGVITPWAVLREYLPYVINLNGEDERGIFHRAAQGNLKYYIKLIVLPRMPAVLRDQITEDDIDGVVEIIDSRMTHKLGNPSRTNAVFN